MVLPVAVSHLLVIVVSENPYASASSHVEEAEESRSGRPKSRRMVWLGSLTFLLSELVFFILMSRLFIPMPQVGTPTPAPDPAGVAAQVSGLLVPLVVAFFVGIGGLVLVVVGVFRSR